MGSEDASAGADTNRTYLSTLGDGDASLTMRSISGTAGTPIWITWVNGATGTLVWGPEGTASGKIKGSVACFISGRSMTEEYDQVAEWQFDFKFNDASGVVFSTW